MKFILNLWPPSQHLFEEITTELAFQFKLLDVSDYRFSDKKEFEHIQELIKDKKIKRLQDYYKSEE